MSTDHTVDTWFKMEEETNYAEGGGSSEYDATLAALVSEFTIACAFPRGDLTMPYTVFDREEVRGVGDDEETVHLFNKDKTKKDCSTKHFLQNKVFIVAAISATAGLPGTSYWMHWQKPEGDFESFGMVVQEYTFEASGVGDFPTESIKWHYYSVDDGAANFAKEAFVETQPMTMKDIVLNIEAADVIYKSISLAITNEFEEFKQGGAWENKKPRLLNRNYELSLTFQSPQSGLVSDPSEEAVDDTLDVIINIGTVANSGWLVTLNNMYVKESNIEHIPEFGMYEYTLTLGIGEGFTSSIADAS